MFVNRLVVGDQVIGAPSSNLNVILGLNEADEDVPPAVGEAISAIDKLSACLRIEATNDVALYSKLLAVEVAAVGFSLQEVNTTILDVPSQRKLSLTAEPNGVAGFVPNVNVFKPTVGV